MTCRTLLLLFFFALLLSEPAHGYAQESSAQTATTAPALTTSSPPAESPRSVAETPGVPAAPALVTPSLISTSTVTSAVVTSTTTITVNATVSATSTVTQTTFPGTLKQVSGDVDAFSDLIASILKAFLLVLLLGLIILLVWQWLLLYIRPQIVFENITNASGDKDLDTMTSGFSQRIRIMLTRELEGIQKELRKYSDQLDREYRNTAARPPQAAHRTIINRILEAVSQLLSKIVHGTKTRAAAALVQIKTPDTYDEIEVGEVEKSVTAVLESIREATEQTKLVVPLVKVLLRPKGNKVTGTLQCRSHELKGQGITFQITNLRNERVVKRRTIWEETYVNPTSSSDPPPNSLSVSPLMSTLPILSGSSPHKDGPSLLADTYHGIGLALFEAGLYKDVIVYAREALKLDKDHQAASFLLTESLRRLQVLERRGSIYDNAKQLEEAGLITEAIKVYSQLLADNEQALDLLSKVVGHEIVDLPSRAKAYLELARLLRLEGDQEGQYLFDGVVELYKQAIECGSEEARQSYNAIQERVADKLTVAGKALHNLGLFDAAERYLLLALTWVPQHDGAQAALAEVRKSKPPEENKEALALYRLGKAYQKGNRWPEAKGRFEEALKKDPDFADALAALEHNLDKDLPTVERYGLLLGSATGWLAAELTRERLLSDKKAKTGHSPCQSYKGQVHNFIGARFQRGGLSHKPCLFFFEYAVEEFEAASRCCPNWYQPHENIADTYSFWAKELMNRNNCKVAKSKECEEAERRLHEALICYERALKLLKEFPNNIDEEGVSRRVNVGKALAQVLLAELEKDTSWLEKARSTIKQVEDQLTDGAASPPAKATSDTDSAPESVLVKWDATREVNDRLLYNIASWYGRAYHVGRNLDDKRAARRYLAYSLTRKGEPKQWTWADNDPDLTAVKGDEWQQFKYELALKLAAMPDLPKLVGPEFESALQAVMKSARWIDD